MQIEELCRILKSNGYDLVKEGFLPMYNVNTGCDICALRAFKDDYVRWGVRKMGQHSFSYKKHLNDLTEKYIVRHIIPEIRKTFKLAMKEKRKQELQKFKNAISEE